jgi:hypothetical protein
VRHEIVLLLLVPGSCFAGAFDGCMHKPGYKKACRHDHAQIDGY